MVEQKSGQVDYRSMYYYLFNAVTDALNSADAAKSREILISAQQHTEEMYISQG